MDVFWGQGSIPDAHPEMDAQVVVQGNEWMCVFFWAGFIPDAHPDRDRCQGDAAREGVRLH